MATSTSGLHPLSHSVLCCRPSSPSLSECSCSTLKAAPLHFSPSHVLASLPLIRRQRSKYTPVTRNLIYCSSGDVSVTKSPPSSPSPSPSPPSLSPLAVSGNETLETVALGSGANWISVIPASALPKGERRVVKQDDETILLLWYKDDVFAIENTSPAEGAYSEGLVNARLTPDGCIVCPTTDTTFDLKTGQIKDWYPTNPVLRFLTRPVRDLDVYPVKVDSGFILVDIKQKQLAESAEIIFGGQTQAGKTATNVNVDEVRMVVDENEQGFGFTAKNELINGRAAMTGFSLLLIFELVTGEGLLKGIGFLDFLDRYTQGGSLIK